MSQKITAINMIGKQTNNEGFFAVPRQKPVVLDGCLDDWDLSGQIESYPDSSSKDIFSCKVAAMWDAENLYLSFDWRDPYPMVSVLHPVRDQLRAWMSDTVVLTVVAGDMPSWITMWCYDHDKSAILMEFFRSEQARARISWDTMDFRRVYYTGVPNQAELGDGVGMAFRMADDKKGFVQEVRIPWTILYDQEHVAKANETIQLAFRINYGREEGWNQPLIRYSDNVQPGVTERGFFDRKKNIWGNLTLLDHPVAEKRIYREAEASASGTIPLRCQVPADAKTFTVTVNTKDGKRIRSVAGGYSVAEYTVEKKDGMATVEVVWDGLDESGKLVSAGEYVIKGITSMGVDAYYESTFYNPGTPAWDMVDKTGGWGADHTLTHLLAASGKGMVVCSRFAESGFGTFLLNTEGERKDCKRWSEIRGSDAVTADENYVYSIPNDWADSGTSFLRLDAHTGQFAPFIQDGVESPMVYPLNLLLETDNPPKVRAVAMSGKQMLARCSDHTVRVIDVNVGRQVKIYHLQHDEEGNADQFQWGYFGDDLPINMTADENAAYYVVNNEIWKLDLATGEESKTPYDAAEIVHSLCLDKEGNMFIVDSGKAQQVLKCAPDGSVLLRIGRYGGRPRQGKYDRNGMHKPTSVAVDASGCIWVTESSHRPRRISVWYPNGEFCREFIGNAGYQGQGTFLHAEDPNKAYAELNEMVFNHETGKWEMSSVLYNPDPKKGLFITPPETPFDTGRVFYSEASGERREYFSALGSGGARANFFLMTKRGDEWKPVAAMTSIAGLLHLYGGNHHHSLVKLPEGEWEDCDPADIIFWNDYNNDGYMTRDECVIVPAVRPTVDEYNPLPVGSNRVRSCMRYVNDMNTCIDTEELAWYIVDNTDPTGKTFGLIKPVRYRDDGIPVYLPEGITVKAHDYSLELGGEFAAAQFVKEKDLVIAFIRQNGGQYVAGIRRSDEEVLWKYRSLYHGVQGSHRAPMPFPGVLIGCLKVCGVAENCGDGTDVFMIRGNMGTDFYITTDGMYVDEMGRDGRLPGIGLPKDPELVRQVSFAQYPGTGEHFCGSMYRHNDGVVRCNSALPAGVSGNVLRVEGLEKIRYYEPVSFTVTDAEIIQADAYNQERALEESKPLPPMEMVAVEGEPEWKQIPAFEISTKGQIAKGWVRMAYDAENLMLRYDVQGMNWVNGGNDWHLLFKTGACLDFQCSPTGNKKYEPAKGDFRLLIAPFQGKNIAVKMCYNDGKSAWDAEHFKYTSPVATLEFQTVRRVEEAQVTVTAEENHVQAVVTVPWAALGMEAPAKPFTGDVGFILANAEGTANTARVYRNNPSTNLVNDQPNEARITPNAFGEVVLKAAE